MLIGVLVALASHAGIACRLRGSAWPVAAALALVAAIALAAALADKPRASIVGTYTDYNGVLYYMPGVACFIAAAALLRSTRALEHAVSAIAICAVPLIAYGFVQFAGLDPFDWDITFGRRPFSLLGQPLVLGGYLAVVTPMIAWLGWRRRAVNGGSCTPRR